ncbi:membrane protein YfhO [Tenacibaculum skagerrakense]|uniref:Membrane protein YfhO n=1 Tax=Tenacibaculum skagerrakense TaxID=186571 RepID=A0A4R2NZN5_9FLAO|nr:YfhO family protein [Tenacibaculum skagerrakense]TCP27001.1 membrane protein YfhO [Tenacibaculum skagerrakense]
MKVNKLLIYTGAVVLFIIVSVLYFNPILSGKQIKQSDIDQFKGISKELKEFREENNKEAYWLGNAFSGMPAYLVSANYENDFLKEVDRVLRFLPRPADYLFLYFLSFFILLTTLKVDWKLSILGGLAFGFSTYLIIIIGAGHNAKAHAIVYMPIIISGVLLIFQNRYLLGFILAALGMAMEIGAGHIQMTYYLGFCLLILGIVELIEAIKDKKITSFIKQTSVIIVAFIIGVGVNASRLMATKEYAEHSIRGKSELTIDVDGKPKKKKFAGLDYDYITQYSYGKLETMNLLVPRFMGGGTIEELGEGSNLFNEFEKMAGTQAARSYTKESLTYWGDQPIVEAPAYIGAVVIFLFFIGVFLVERKLKYWLVSATIFSIVLSWGKNLAFVTNFFIDYVPLYDKFRAVSSIQVIAELCMPLLAVLGLSELFKSRKSNEEKFESLKKSFIITTGLIVVGFLLAHMTSSFEGIRDNQYQQYPALLDALISDRKSMLFYDSLRSIVLILLTAGLVYQFLKYKLKKQVVYGGVLALVLFDLISVNINYVNKENFVSSRLIEKPFTPNKVDLEILKDTSYYRVANFTGNFMNENRTSFFHRSVGGYHAAKLKRYQELIDYQVAKNNMEVFNMLNAKYFIVGEDKFEVNKEANGNAWFVSSLIPVTSANEEIIMLTNLDTKKEAVIRGDKYTGTTKFASDSLATISLVKRDLNDLKYLSNATKNQFAVFSEIYYGNGWNAYLDGKLVPHYQVNYVLRGMQVPAGKHTIEFKFEPTVVAKGGRLSLYFYLLLVLVPFILVFLKKKNLLT